MISGNILRNQKTDIIDHKHIFAIRTPLEFYTRLWFECLYIKTENYSILSLAYIASSFSVIEEN